jgi:hypothetical protein
VVTAAENVSTCWAGASWSLPPSFRLAIALFVSDFTVASVVVCTLSLIVTTCRAAIWSRSHVTLAAPAAIVHVPLVVVAVRIAVPAGNAFAAPGAGSVTVTWFAAVAPFVTVSVYSTL